MKVGFIGLGSMGYGQAMLLANSEHELTVYDVADKAMEPFAGKATLAKTLADVAIGNEVVGVCVRDDAQVNECAAALIPAMSKDSVLLVHSTVQPATIKTLAEQAAARGVHLLDVPVTRTVIEQDAPFVYSMIGGDESIANRVLPVLEVFSTDTIYVGPLGSGAAMKISNNLVSWSQIMIGLEAFRVAEAAGVPTEKLLTVMQKNGCLTPPMKGFIEFTQQDLDEEKAAFIASQFGIGDKDLSLAEKLSADAETAAPIASFVRGVVRERLK